MGFGVQLNWVTGVNVVLQCYCVWPAGYWTHRAFISQAPLNLDDCY